MYRNITDIHANFKNSCHDSSLKKIMIHVIHISCTLSCTLYIKIEVPITNLAPQACLWVKSPWVFKIIKWRTSSGISSYNNSISKIKVRIFSFEASSKDSIPCQCLLMHENRGGEIHRNSKLANGCQHHMQESLTIITDFAHGAWLNNYLQNFPNTILTIDLKLQYSFRNVSLIHELCGQYFS